MQHTSIPYKTAEAALAAKFAGTFIKKNAGPNRHARRAEASHQANINRQLENLIRVEGLLGKAKDALAKKQAVAA